MRALSGLLLVAAACTSQTFGLNPVFAPQSSDFFATPFPSDARLGTAQGWSAFPNPTRNPVLTSFLDLADRLPGAGMNAPIWIQFSDTPELDLLPTPEESTHRSSTVQLVNIDPHSPDFTKRTPLVVRWFEDPGTYLPGRLLAAAPVAGHPLLPNTRYALIITRDLADRSDAFADVFSDRSSAWGESLGDLRRNLPWIGLLRADIATATVFTTYDPLAQMNAIATSIAQRLDAPWFQPDVSLVQAMEHYEVYRTDYTTPLWMSGTKPYATSGGAFVFDDDGVPAVQSWEPMRMSVVVPPNHQSPPEGGWPVLLYLHGTGGDWRTFADSNSPFEVGQWATEQGFVGLGIDLPLHGARGTPDTIIDLHSFNVLQPDSALHIHRQAAADVLYALRGLTAHKTIFHLPDGSDLPLSTENIVIVGHSQGGITGALALPWVGGRVKAAVLSGAGGLLAITAVERQETVDFSAMIRQLLKFDPEEPLNELHPVLGLVQSLVELTDPINYAPAWFHENRRLHGQAPTQVLLTSGTEDADTPPRTAEALASAAHLPFAGPRATPAPGLVLQGFDGTPWPVSDNVINSRRKRQTSGFSQFVGASHFAIFEDEDALHLVKRFVSTAVEDDPVLDIAPYPPE